MNRLVFLLSAFVIAAAVAGCTGPGQGERCNPLLFSDECSGGNSCQTPTGCAVAYCCPPPDKVTASTSPNCRVCPTDDAGTTDDAGVGDAAPPQG